MARWTSRLRRSRPAPYVLLLAGAVVCSGALLIALGSRVSFDLDDWVVLIQHPGLLEPHVGHNIVSIATIYRFIQETFGMSSIVPWVVFATLCFLAAAVVLFIWLRERVGNWLALAGAVSILFLGSAHEDLLVPFQISFYVPVACGLGAMLALARRTTKADVLAAALLTYSLTYNGLGLAFTVGCAILLAFDRGDRRRLWVTAVPVVLFALWYLGWGHTDPQSHRSWANLADSPIFILDGFASAVAALAGLATQRDEAQISPLDWGRPLLALLVVCGAVLAIRARRAHPGLWAALGAGLTFWFPRRTERRRVPPTDLLALHVPGRDLCADDRRRALTRRATRSLGIDRRVRHPRPHGREQPRRPARGVRPAFGEDAGDQGRTRRRSTSPRPASTRD